MNVKNKINLFLDSGAFSAWTQGVNIDIQDYIAFIKEHQDVIEVYANLDIISRGNSTMDKKQAAEKTLENQRIMEEAGLSPLPVFHVGEVFSYLQYYINNYEYIALGGMVGKQKSTLIPWLDDCFGQFICDKKGNPKVKVHGFGLTSLSLMLRYPWYCMTEEDHQVLTKEGWKSLSDLRVGMEILASNQGKAEWQRIEEIPVFKVEGAEIDHLWNRNFEAFVTGNHRWVISPQNKKNQVYKVKTTDTLLRTDCIARSPVDYEFPTTPTYQDDLISLLAWFWTDGTIKERKNFRKDSVVLYQSSIANPEKCQIIQDLIDRLEEPHYKHVAKKDGGVSWELYGSARDWLLSIAPNKTLPENFAFSLTKKQAEDFLHYSILADGTKSGLKRVDGFEITVWRDKKKPNLNVLRDICLLLGVPTSIFEGEGGISSSLRSSSVSHIYVRCLKKEKIRYTGKLWCVRVPAGAFFTKCRDHIYVTGNSVDSTSWVTTGRTGSIYVPRFQNGRWIYDKNSWKIAVSSRSPSSKEAGRHINTLSPKQKEIVLKYIHEKGYKLGESRFKYVSQSHELAKNERWAEKKPKNKSARRLLEIIEEPGLSNKYQLRDEINIIYFQDLEKTMLEWPWPFKQKGMKGFRL